MSHKKLHRFLIRFFSIATLSLVPLAVTAFMLTTQVFSGVKQTVATYADRKAQIIATEELRVFSGVRNTLLGVSEFAEVKSRNTRDCSKTMAILMDHINTPIK